ncbi:MAG: thioredoxin domain-containing protein [Thermodesulfobacteriota bacterium]
MTDLPNRLAREKSPYLLQHAHHPVEWYPWGDEAWTRARAEDKPVFLSIGYATCHWCHVMAHESFEDQDVARTLNERYIALKVDREERPDLDQVYMAACQVLTGQGGWPLTVFLTPEGKPFYAGTYFPRTSRQGRVGLIELLNQLADKWRSHREIVLKAADQLTQALLDPLETEVASSVPGEESLERAGRLLNQAFDQQWGGFGGPPKFPTPHHLNFLLRRHHRSRDRTALPMVDKTLTAMRRGGIYDHLGFGFHRYSVDEKWLAPHFEKMLYDQALLALAYTEAWQVTGRPLYRRTVEEIFSYLRREMTSPEGGFYTAEDADSQGREGLFYLWRPEEIESVLGPDLGRLFIRIYGVTPAGNFEGGLSVLHLGRPWAELANGEGLTEIELTDLMEQARDKLFQTREKRVRPFKDDKVLTAWNGLAIAALAKAGQVLVRPEYIGLAARAADFILDRLGTGQGRLLRRYRLGEAVQAAYQEDYAFLAWGLIELYQAGFEIGYLEEAIRLTRLMLDLFWDRERGGLFFTGAENERLIARKKETYDGALPSGNSVAALNLLRLGRLTGADDLETKAHEILKAAAGDLTKYPLAHTHLLMALDFTLGPNHEAIIAGDIESSAGRAMLAAAGRGFHPGRVIMHAPSDEGRRSRLAALAPFISSIEPSARPALYLCRDQTCQRPTTDLTEAEKALTEG